MLLGYAILAKAYFFTTPFRGVVVALLCYGIGLAAA